jgi:DNA-binding NtrC family response regulator
MPFSGTFVVAMIDASSNGLPDDVLVVEDDPIIALDFEDTVRRFGVKTVRTAGTVTRALQLIEERAPEFALLDIGLLREKSFAVAERLEALGIPFAFISGYGTDAVLPIAFAQKPRLPKPCTADAMQAMLRSAVARRAAE